MDSEIPSKQEINNQVEDLDLTINLPSEESQQSKATKSRVHEIRSLLRERLELAKKREYLTYGKTCGDYPPWFTVKNYCHLNLDDKDDDNKFKDFWKELATATKEQLADKVVSFLNKRIKEKEAEANQIRSETVKKIGFATKESAKLRKNLDEEILEINEENGRELEVFRSELSKRDQMPKHNERSNIGSAREYRNNTYPQRSRSRGFRRNYTNANQRKRYSPY